MENQPQWYLIQTISQRERSAQAAIGNAAHRIGLAELIHEIVVPTHSQTHYQSGKRITREKITFPGYLLAKMELNDELQRMVQGVTGVRGFVVDYESGQEKPAPTPMAEIEVKRFMARPAPISHGLSQGDEIRITGGPFAEVTAYVQGVDENTGRISATVNLFGRVTPVELDSSQVIKV